MSNQEICDLLQDVVVRLARIEQRLDRADAKLGPKPNTGEERAAEVARRLASTRPTPTPVPAPPVNRLAVELTSGESVPENRSHTELKANGQQKDYVVLSAEERSKGFVRPVRRSYRHERCGAVTTMGLSLAETYARNPEFYSGTFCATCGAHYPVGPDGEFTWLDDNSKVGT